MEKSLETALHSGLYGSRMMVEEYLPGKEVTISVLPVGRCLPIVDRLNHINGIAPYNGEVAVTENSRAIVSDEPLKNLCEACSQIMKTLKLKALIRIDCRQNAEGSYKMFDINMKPNMTGASRPHRKN